MGKGKQRHNPDKAANRYGDSCGYAHTIRNDTVWICELLKDEIGLPTCHGNRHNCVKTTYKLEALRRKD